jgi:phenylalanyl-tRNA synthetase beta chain
MKVMRPSLIPSLILAALRTLNYGLSRTALFEGGNVFFDNCRQDFQISGLRVGDICERSWLQKTRKADVFDVKGDMLIVLGYYGVEEKDITIPSEVSSYYHPSRSGAVYIGKKKVGYFGELHPKIKKLFSLTESPVCFELSFANLEKKPPVRDFVTKVFPKINRDFSFVFDERTSIGNLLEMVYKIDKRILKAGIFDCFNIPNGRKSVGLAVTLGAPDRTLTEEEAAAISNEIIKCVKNIGGELRK